MKIITPIPRTFYQQQQASHFHNQQTLFHFHPPLTKNYNHSPTFSNLFHQQILVIPKPFPATIINNSQTFSS